MGTMIRDKIEGLFLEKLKCIVIENLHNEQFGVSELAEKVGVSRSYLHRKLTRLKNQSASKFIREIRLKEAYKLLKENGFTASEVAYKVGFNDPSYFNTCFHEYYGYPPGQLKKLLLFTSKELELKPVDELRGFRTVKSKSIKNIKNRKRILFFAISVFLIVIAFILTLFISSLKTEKLSIVVLPFKNLSSDTKSSYLADAIVDQIITRLSGYNEIEVKSPSLINKSNIDNLSDNDIAKITGATYLLKGSIIPEKEKVRIVVQLVSTKTDDHIWGQYFDKNLTGINSFISEISEKITGEIIYLLSEKKIEGVKNRYTTNRKASDMYLEGRFFYRLRTRENFLKSIELYKEAIILDPEFCLAYAGLADSYLTSTWYGIFSREDGIPKSRENALKAINLNKTLAEPHATLGGIATYFDYEWDMAESELKMAMHLDPEYSRAYKIYSEYMDIIGNNREARNYIDKAIELHPTLPILFWHSHYYYYKEGKFDKAFVELDKEFLLNNNKQSYLKNSFFLYLAQYKFSQAIFEYKKLSDLIYSSESVSFLTSNTAKSDSIKTIRKIIEIERNHGASHYEIAKYYAVIDDKNATLNFLEKSFEEGEGAIARMKYERVFNNIKSDPRFILLLKKMNLADN